MSATTVVMTDSQRITFLESEVKKLQEAISTVESSLEGIHKAVVMLKNSHDIHHGVYR